VLDTLLALVLALAGLAVFGYLAGLLWQAASDPLAGILERGRLEKCEDRVARGDAALRDGRVAEALDCFATALYASPVKSASMASVVEKHHTGLLNRFLAASDRRRGENVGLLSLAVADRALRRRRELQSAYVAALQTGNRRRRREVEGQLRSNAKELRKAFKDLAGEVLGGGRDQVSVH
jgi:hypothetical protein